MSDSLLPHELEHARLPCPSSSPGVYSDSCPLSWWCHPTISSSVTFFSSCPQSFPASGFFQWVGSSYQVVKVLELQFQQHSFQWIFRLICFRIDWFHLLAVSRVFSSTTIWKHQFFSTQPSLWYSSHIRTCLLEKR